MSTQLHKPADPELEASEFGTMGGFLSSVGRGDVPVAVMLTCWELGFVPDEVSHARQGEILVVQNPAGIVPRWDETGIGSAAAAVDYALKFPTVRHLIVCGHRQCRTIPMLLNDRRPNLLPQFRDIVRDVRDDLDRRDDPPMSPNQRMKHAIQGVILQQIQHLKSYPFVRDRLEVGALVLHGWFYDDKSAVVRPYDPKSRQF